jgi:hypothetical protein
MFMYGASFARATFSGEAGFDTAAFANSFALFRNATFSNNAHFYSAMFTDEALFSGATFYRGADFRDADFFQVPELDGARVLRLDDPALTQLRAWPQGWTVQPDADDPSRGTLIPEQRPEGDDVSSDGNPPLDGESSQGP